MDEKNYDDDVRLDWYDDEPVEQPKDDEVLDSYYDFGWVLRDDRRQPAEGNKTTIFLLP